MADERVDEGLQLAFLNPLRKRFYNIAITGLSIVVVSVIGTVDLL